MTTQLWNEKKLHLSSAMPMREEAKPLLDWVLINFFLHPQRSEKVVELSS